jgi:hypothetical protein
MSLLGDMFTAVTGVSADKAKDWAWGQAKSAFRNFVCECGHMAQLHQHGVCTGRINGVVCACKGFHSLADKDRENAT